MKKRHNNQTIDEELAESGGPQGTVDRENYLGTVDHRDEIDHETVHEDIGGPQGSDLDEDTQKDALVYHVKDITGQDSIGGAQGADDYEEWETDEAGER